MPGFRTSSQDGAPSGTGPDLQAKPEAPEFSEPQARAGLGGTIIYLSQKWLVRITPPRFCFYESFHRDCQRAVFEASREDFTKERTLAPIRRANRSCAAA
jgi:hypothetical protein